MTSASRTICNPLDLPYLFQDSDNSLYLYWGCDNKTPIYGVRLSDAFTQIGEPVPLIASDVETRGWEQRGDNHLDVPPRTEAERLAALAMGSDPYIEGAWMTERDGTYYLQYA